LQRGEYLPLSKLWLAEMHLRSPSPGLPYMYVNIRLYLIFNKRVYQFVTLTCPAERKE